MKCKICKKNWHETGIRAGGVCVRCKKAAAKPLNLGSLRCWVYLTKKEYLNCVYLLHALYDDYDSSFFARKPSITHRAFTRKASALQKDNKLKPSSRISFGHALLLLVAARIFRVRQHGKYRIYSFSDTALQKIKRSGGFNIFFKTPAKAYEKKDYY